MQIGEPLSEELTMDEIRSHFALWAIAKSPLFISTDLRCALLRNCDCGRKHIPLCMT